MKKMVRTFLIKNISKLFFIIALFLPVLTLAESQEYMLKATFIEKFIQFTEWPEESIKDNTKPFIIGVIGENPFEDTLDMMFRKEKIKGKKVEIRYLERLDQIQGCRLLFVSSKTEYDLSDILSVSNGSPILTVSEIPGFSEKGGHINFYFKFFYYIFYCRNYIIYVIAR